MNSITGEKRRRCLICKKYLLEGEVLPICLRCSLQGRNYTSDGAKIVGSLAALASYKLLFDKKDNTK